MFRKLEFDMIFCTYLNESPFNVQVLYKHFRRGWGVQNSGKPAYKILARSLKTWLVMVICKIPSCLKSADKMSNIGKVGYIILAMLTVLLFTSTEPY